jgi:hypothetical protein
MGAHVFDAAAPLSAAIERAGFVIERIERRGLSLAVSVVARTPRPVAAASAGQSSERGGAPP